MDLNTPEDADYWRGRAAEARAIAVQMTDAHARAVMLGIAQDYEKHAVRAEQRAGETPADGTMEPAGGN